MGAKVLETLNIADSSLPVDLNAVAVTGDIVSLKGYKRCLAVISFGDGTATTGDLTITVRQQQDVAGTGVKDLDVLETGRIYTKMAADQTAVAALTGWTEETQATADAVYTDATSGEQAGIWAFEIKSTDLDTDNGFDCFSMNVAATSTAKIASTFYILSEPRQADAPEDMTDPLVD